ncbi:histidine kinase, partial [Paenibacillus sepulcri]|nr:histidine kinase [Paenibacillus sepulcri]
MLLVKRRFKLTIYPKIVFVFLLVIVPLCTLSLFINQKGKESVREELSKQMEASVQKFMDSFSTEIDRMSKHQREFIDDKDLQSISFGGSVLDSYEMTQRILKIQEKLSMIQISSALISKVSAYIPTINRVISSQNIIADLPADEYGMVVKASATGGAAIVEWQSRLFIVLSYPYYGFYDKEPSYALSIELNVDTIRHELSQFSTYGNGGAILWNRNQNWSLASGTDDTLNKAIQASYEPPESKLGVYPYHYDNDRYLISYRTGAEKDLSLAVYVPEEEVLGKLSAYGSWFWMLSIISIVVIFIFSAWIYRVIHRPMSHLVHSLRKVEKGVLEKMPVTRRGDEFSYLYTQFNSMVDQLKVLIHVVYEQKIRSQSSELKQLQSQINPHFLYNTYFTLYRLAKMHDIDKVILFCEHLGEYFQYITRGAAEQVPMTMELGHAKSYTDIQGIRFSSRIEVEF